MGILSDKEILLAKMTGDYLEDRKFLLGESEKRALAGDTEGAKAAMELIMEIMPEDTKEEFNRLMYIDGVRLDIFHEQILDMIKAGSGAIAISMAEQLYSKITENFVNDGQSRFVCLRNSFEDNLYQLLFKPKEKLNRAPFDFSRMFTTYGFLLVDSGNVTKAVKVLNEAMEYNPVDCGPKFELAEAYKFGHNAEELLKVTRETLDVASSPDALARCYANFGYALTDMGKYEDAVVFYYTSFIFQPHPAIEAEIKHTAELAGKSIDPPTKEKITDTFAKYDLVCGATEMTLTILAQLANIEIVNNNLPVAVMYLKIFYGLTKDPDAEKKILEIEEIIKEKEAENE